MRTQLLIDNWTLQSCGEVLSNGITGDTTADLLVEATAETELYEDVLADVVRRGQEHERRERRQSEPQQSAAERGGGAGSLSSRLRVGFAGVIR